MTTVRTLPDDLSTIAGPRFIVTDRLGDIELGTYRGLFIADTRYLSRYTLRLNGSEPLLLRAGQVAYGKTQIFATNIGLDAIPDQSLSLMRLRSLDADFAEEITLTNHSLDTIELAVELAFDADFADIFEVRGYLSDRLPEPAAGCVVDSQIQFSSGSIEQQWQTSIGFSCQPDVITPRLVTFDVELPADATWNLTVTVECTRPASRSALPIPVFLSRMEKERTSADGPRTVPTLHTDDPALRCAYDQSIRDLATLEFALSNGQSILAAGVPWYVAIFGRDAIIAALQTLPIAPHLAVGALRTLAAYQATESDAFRDAEPGKIPHEIRFGPLAESSAVPHARYYGTVDATPLWLMLLAATYRWTGDIGLVQELLPTAEKALHWIDVFGDSDSDGFIEYQTRSPAGLVNQGWKDSWNSVRFANGRLADPPIALVEVQGYAFAARIAMADLYEAIGGNDDAARLRANANDLAQRVHDAFWMPAEQCYAMALDGKKRQVDGIASNQGHLLWSGLPDPEFGHKIVDRLMAPDCFSGWGIRTLSSSMRGYNPIGYHIGSVWPHDTALIAAGFRRYGRDEEAATLIDGLIDATQAFEEQRLPELFAGWDRLETPFVVDCPVACSPQAWAAGAIIMMLSEIAGIHVGDTDLRVDPTTMSRPFKLTGLPFKGSLYTIEVAADGSGSVVAESDSRPMSR